MKVEVRWANGANAPAVRLTRHPCEGAAERCSALRVNVLRMSALRVRPRESAVLSAGREPANPAVNLFISNALSGAVP